MLKYLIFFTLILFIQNLSDKEKEYLEGVYNLTTKTKMNIIANLREEVLSLQEEETILCPSLKSQIMSFGFQITDQDKIKIKVNTYLIFAKEAIKQHVVDNKIRGNGKNDLGELFISYINYGRQWKKYDLLVSEGEKIRALSIFTKKIKDKYITIYFTSLKKITYRYKNFVLINESINEDNPFNNFYYLTEYDYKKILGPFYDYKIVSKNDNIDIPYINVLIKYYSIFSYYVIANKLEYKFITPFEY